MQTNNRPRNLMIFSAVTFGTLAPFVRHIPLASAELALWRAVLAALLLGVWLLLSHSSIPWKAIRRALPLLALSGMAIGINWILLFQSYRYTTVSVATLSYYFAPVLVTILCPVLFHERLSRKQILCFVMSTLGVVLIVTDGGLSGTGTDFIGVMFGLGAAVFYAAVILLNKCIHDVTGVHRTFIQFLAAIVTVLPYVALTSGFHLHQLDGVGWANLLIVGFCHTGITYCLYFTALKDLPGQKAAILSYLDPLTAVLLSVTLLGEPISPAQLTGGALVLGFAIWNEFLSRQSPRQPS